jgi:tRNA(Ile)-lysidine synthase TilS/MesJ
MSTDVKEKEHELIIEKVVNKFTENAAKEENPCSAVRRGTKEIENTYGIAIKEYKN